MANKAKEYSEEQIIAIVKEINEGGSLASISRTPGVNMETLYRWHDKYGGMTTPMTARKFGIPVKVL